MYTHTCIYTWGAVLSHGGPEVGDADRRRRPSELCHLYLCPCPSQFVEQICIRK